MGVKEFIDELLATHPVVVFSKTYCPFCVKAKKALAATANMDKVFVLEMENRPDCSELQGHLKTLTGASSVPRVFIGGKCIGGGDETAQLAASGQLKGLLTQAGAA